MRKHKPTTSPRKARPKALQLLKQAGQDLVIRLLLRQLSSFGAAFKH